MRALLPLLFIALPALADEPKCGPRDEIVAKLAHDYGEAQTGAGLSRDGVMVEVYASPATGTFTVLASDPSGQSCLVTYGGEWVSVPAGDPL